MNVEQFPYLSPDACALRDRDGTPPWGVHPCEVAWFGPRPPADPDRLADSWATTMRAAWALRDAIEAEPDPTHEAARRDTMALIESVRAHEAKEAARQARNAHARDYQRRKAAERRAKKKPR